MDEAPLLKKFSSKLKGIIFSLFILGDSKLPHLISGLTSFQSPEMYQFRGIRDLKFNFSQLRQLPLINVQSSKEFFLEFPALESEQQHLLTQKSSQLEASLETASKFKIYFHQEKDKTDTLEQSIAIQILYL